MRPNQKIRLKIMLGFGSIERGNEQDDPLPWKEEFIIYGNFISLKYLNFLQNDLGFDDAELMGYNENDISKLEIQLHYKEKTGV